MENKIMKFGYEDTDKKVEVEIYGLIFEINKEEMSKSDTDILENGNEESLEDAIKKIIGEDAIEKINQKRKEDGYNEMTIDVEVAVLSCLYKAYISASADKFVDAVYNTPKEYEEKYFNPQKMNYSRNQYYSPNRYERRNARYGRR